jgi:uncharacterized protein
MARAFAAASCDDTVEGPGGPPSRWLGHPQRTSGGLWSLASWLRMRDKGSMEAITYLVELTDEVSRFLLTTEEVGRVAFVDDDGYPVVLPVNYRLEGDLVLFRTGAGSKLDHVPLRPVAFEADHLAPSAHAGWSVLVQGRGADVTTSLGPVYERLRALPLEFWAPGPRDHWLAIEMQRISGRKVVNLPGPRSATPPADY